MQLQDIGIKWFNTVFYPQNKTGRAMRYDDGVLSRLRSNTVTLFTPWGPRYSWKKRGILITETDKELEVLNFLRDMIHRWKDNMPQTTFRWLFLGADLYGTEINNLPTDVVAGYFEEVKCVLQSTIPFAEFRLWSSFNDEASPYRTVVQNDFETFVDSNLLTRAEHTARMLKTGGDPRAYLIERLSEAMFIEETFHPVKISCVGRQKDVKVDWQLPVLYFLPEYLHAPWL
ncbi:MAG: hypothetical protein V1652_03800 [bacterium]